MKATIAILTSILVLTIAGPVLGRNNDPVTLCHKPGTPAEHTITVDDNSVIQAHLRHGDTLGPCVVTPEPTATPEPTPTGDVGTAVETHKPPKDRISQPGTTTATHWTPTLPPSDTAPVVRNEPGSSWWLVVLGILGAVIISARLAARR